MKMKRKMISFFIFPSNGAPVEWNWQGKTEVLGEKPVPVLLCPPQIPHGPTRDRIRVFAVRGRRLTAWAMARPSAEVKNEWSYTSPPPNAFMACTGKTFIMIIITIIIIRFQTRPCRICGGTGARRSISPSTPIASSQYYCAVYHLQRSYLILATDSVIKLTLLSQLFTL
jgi:hypothetical protein